MIKITKYSGLSDLELLSKVERREDIAAAVSEIIETVRKRGDAALYEYCERFDGVRPAALELDRSALTAARAAVGEDFWGVLCRSAENITEFHKRQIRDGFEIKKDDGVILGQKITPIEKIGVYIPGGTAPLASTVLMTVIPAKLAGCGSIIMCTPPQKNGVPDPAILAAAAVSGVDRVFAVGGAQAIAAMSYGTKSIPAADKIVGPGNAYVAEAKRRVFGVVGIDMIAGPSEILIIADSSANPAHLAADMLSQAEHDRLASAILVTPDESLAAAVSAELERQIPLLPRRDIARESIDNNSKIIITQSISEAIEISNRIAPEHLELCVADPLTLLSAVKNAGSIFLGNNCPEALGDYYAGPNHTLPTGGTARFSSPLSVDDFTKKSAYTYYPKSALTAAAADISAFALREELTAHARSVTIRCP